MGAVIMTVINTLRRKQIVKPNINVIITPSAEIKAVASFANAANSVKTTETGSHSLYSVVIVYIIHIPPSIIALLSSRIITSTGINSNNNPLTLYRTEIIETAMAQNSQKKTSVVVLTSIEKADVNAPNVQNTATKIRRMFPT